MSENSLTTQDLPLKSRTFSSYMLLPEDRATPNSYQKGYDFHVGT